MGSGFITNRCPSVHNILIVLLCNICYWLRCITKPLSSTCTFWILWPHKHCPALYRSALYHWTIWSCYIVNIVLLWKILEYAQCVTMYTCWSLLHNQSCPTMYCLLHFPTPPTVYYHIPGRCDVMNRVSFFCNYCGLLRHNPCQTLRFA